MYAEKCVHLQQKSPRDKTTLINFVFGIWDSVFDENMAYLVFWLVFGTMHLVISSQNYEDLVLYSAAVVALVIIPGGIVQQLGVS